IRPSSYMFLSRAPPTLSIYTLSLHDALPILLGLALWPPTAEARHLKVYSPYALDKGEAEVAYWFDAFLDTPLATSGPFPRERLRSEEHTSELQSRFDLVCRLLLEKKQTTLP